MGKIKNPTVGAVNPKSPVSWQSIKNPLSDGGRIKRLKEHHTRNLKAMGLAPLKNPVK